VCVIVMAFVVTERIAILMSEPRARGTRSVALPWA
jgi:hypothetical protein